MANTVDDAGSRGYWKVLAAYAAACNIRVVIMPLLPTGAAFARDALAIALDHATGFQARPPPPLTLQELRRVAETAHDEVVMDDALQRPLDTAAAAALRCSSPLGFGARLPAPIVNALASAVDAKTAAKQAPRSTYGGEADEAIRFTPPASPQPAHMARTCAAPRRRATAPSSPTPAALIAPTPRAPSSPPQTPPSTPTRHGTEPLSPVSTPSPVRQSTPTAPPRHLSPRSSPSLRTSDVVRRSQPASALSAPGVARRSPRASPVPGAPAKSLHPRPVNADAVRAIAARRLADDFVTDCSAHTLYARRSPKGYALSCWT